MVLSFFCWAGCLLVVGFQQMIYLLIIAPIQGFFLLWVGGRSQLLEQIQPCDFRPSLDFLRFSSIAAEMMQQTISRNRDRFLSRRRDITSRFCGISKCHVWTTKSEHIILYKN